MSQPVVDPQTSPAIEARKNTSRPTQADALAGTLPAAGILGADTLNESWTAQTILVGNLDSADLNSPNVTWTTPPPGAAGASADGFNTLSAGRSTVLPRIRQIGEGPRQLVVEERDRYEEIKPLGAGGVGEVVLVRDNDIDRMVALKRLKTELREPADLVRFAEEVRTIGQLEHPNIVPVHDVGLGPDGKYFFVMKHVAGETMESIIQKLRAGNAEYHARYSFEYRAQIMIEVLRAIQYAHSNGVIHRDIKPANIMIGQYGEVTVMDWGLAKRTSDVKTTLEKLPAQANPAEPAAQAEPAEGRMFETQYGALLGTPAYMSPEQALGKTDEIGEASDIYSLGATAYELLSLQHYLAHKKTVAAMLTGVVEEQPLMPVLINNPHQGRVPAELAAVILRSMHKDPRQRHSSASDMIFDFQMALEGKCAVQCPTTFTRRFTHGMNHIARQNPFIMVGLFALVGGLSLWGLVSLVLSAIPG